MSQASKMHEARARPYKVELNNEERCGTNEYATYVGMSRKDQMEI